MSIKDKFKNLFKKVPSPKKVAGDVVDRVKEGEEKLKKGIGDAVKASGDAVKASSNAVKKTVKDSEERLKEGVGDAVKASGDAVKASSNAMKKTVKKTVKDSEERLKEGVGDAVDKIKHKEDDGSSTESTYKQEKFITLKDSDIPWFRRWFMFAFFYPTIISFLLEWLRRSLQGSQ